jgi:hypothetical protein
MVSVLIRPKLALLVLMTCLVSLVEPDTSRATPILSNGITLRAGTVLALSSISIVTLGDSLVYYSIGVQNEIHGPADQFYVGTYDSAVINGQYPISATSIATGSYPGDSCPAPRTWSVEGTYDAESIAGGVQTWSQIAWNT